MHRRSVWGLRLAEAQEVFGTFGDGLLRICSPLILWCSVGFLAVILRDELDVRA